MQHQEPVGASGRPRRRPSRGPTPVRASAGRVAVPVVLCLALLAGCTGEDGQAPGREGRGPSGADGARSGEAAVRTVVVPGKRVGLLSPQRHRQVARRVAEVVDGWWDAAFVDADYPRRRYQDSFPGFTRAAAGQAWRQRDLMTSARLGERIDALVPLRRRVAVDVLATRQVPRGATARVRMDYRTTGEVEKRIRVQGRLVLTYSRGWKVFGFDVTQGPWATGRPGGTRGGKQDGPGKQGSKQSGGTR